jgi:hypothetical protein
MKQKKTVQSVQILSHKTNSQKSKKEKNNRLDHEWGYYSDDEADLVSFFHDYEHSADQRYFN